MKALDYIIIFCVSLAVLLGSAFVYTGSPEELELIKDELFASGLKRTLAYGIPGALILFGIRYVMYQLIVGEADQPGRKTLLYSSLIIIILMALIGSIIFLNGGVSLIQSSPN